MTDQDPQPGTAAAGWEEANAETAAAGWEANADRTDERLCPVTDWLIDRSDVQAGDIVLDLAAGPGGVGHRASELAGTEGRALSTDLAPAMVDAAQRIGARRGLSNVAAVFRGLLAATARTPAKGRTVLLQSVDRSATS